MKGGLSGAPHDKKETRVKYVLLILDTPEEPKAGTPEYGAWYAEVGAWYEKWGATGRLDGGHQLQAASAAKTVRGTTVTDESGSASNIWNRVIARADKVPAASQALLQPVQDAPGFYAYAPDLLLGNSGDHHLPC